MIESSRRLYGWQIHPFKADQLAPLQAAAKADSHTAICPTHVATLDGNICGYFSMNAVPLIMAWADTKLMKARTSVEALRFMENLMAGGGAPAIVVPVQESSPFFKHMTHMGYVDLDTAHLFAKKLI